MNDFNRSADKAQRVCTTPERMRLIESIKKSIHRSIEKINPAEYKNILKGQYIYMHLCYKGQIINSQYTKVALFLGGIVLKRASEKVTIVITNQSSNKIVKKLISMNKPVLSVLWLEACFQEKRKVPYEDFFFQQQSKDYQNDDQKQEQVSVDFDPLVKMYRSQFNFISKQFAKAHNTKCLRFIQKKQKISSIINTIIPVHQIDITKYLPQNNQKRRSHVITQKIPKKKNLNKKVEFKSEGSLKQPPQNNLKSFVIKKTESNDQIDKFKDDHQGVHQSQKQNSLKNRLNKSVYEKYLKDFKKYEETIKQNEQLQKIAIPLQESQTPCFMGFGELKNASKNLNELNTNCIQTPPRTVKQQSDDVFQTYSIKRLKDRFIRVNIVNPIISQKISKLNEDRQIENLPLIQITGSDSKNLIWIISQQSKVQAILALLSKPKIIVNQQFIAALQKQPLLEINQSQLKKYEIRCRLNTKEIEGKKVVLIDSVFGVSLMQKIIRQCRGEILSKNDYLLKSAKADFVITNKKYFTKSNKQQGKVLFQAKFIDSLIQFYK